MINILIATIIVLIIIILYLIKRIYNIYHDLYEGLWVADDDFCTSSQIDGMMIYIGGLNNDNIRNAYLIMHTDNNIIVNKKIEILFQPSYLTPRNFYIYLTDQSDEDDLESIMPLKQYINVDISTGKMTWTGDDDIIYANFYKDNASSK